MRELIRTRAVTTTPASKRPRRLRANEAMRRLVRETRLDPSRLVAPLFIVSGRNRRQEITSLKGHARLSPDLAVAEAHRLASQGIGGVLLFGIPDHKDEDGHGAADESGPVPETLRLLLAEKLPRLRTLGATVIANVWGDTEEEYVAVVEALQDAEGLAAIELNISCPNVEKGGMLFGNSPTATASLVSRVRAATRSTLIVKLSPNAPDLVESARAARDTGADVLSLVNTFVGMAIDPETARPRLSFGTGGLSGPAIKPLALRMVFQVARALPGVPLMGIGGISDLSDVLEFLAAGASAVQIGTANFRDPGVSGRLVKELTAFCAERRVTVSELVGRAQRIGTGGEAGAEG